MTSTSAVSFTVRRPSPVSRAESSGADSDGPSFKIPALPKHLRNGGSTPGSPLAQSESAASSPKRSYDSVDSSDEEDGAQDELISGFDKFGVQRLREKPKPKIPLVIPALKNRDWRALAKKRKTAQMYVPESGRAAVTGADGTVGGLGTRGTINSGPQAIGLQLKQKGLASEVGEVDMHEAEVEVKPPPEESEDQLALRALLASAAGEGDEAFASRTTVIPVTEGEAYRQDIDELPDSSTLNDYTDMPVSEFGAAMLRGMGWGGDGKGKKNVQPWLPQSRPALLGIGAKEKEIFDDGSKKKFFGKPDKKYIPIVKKERPSDNSHTPSKNRTPSPSRTSGARRKTRSPSPRRKDRTSRDDDRKGDRDGERRSDRSSDRRKGEHRDRDGERKRFGDDDRDRRREREEGGHRDRNRDDHNCGRDSRKRDRSRNRYERSGERRD